MVCPECGGRLRLVAMVKAEKTTRAILSAMYLPFSPTGPLMQEKPVSLEAHEEELEWNDRGTEGKSTTGWSIGVMRNPWDFLQGKGWGLLWVEKSGRIGDWEERMSRKRGSEPNSKG
jgi:hypothetical protein